MAEDNSPLPESREPSAAASGDDFLTDQIAQSRAAFMRVADDIHASLASAPSLEAWARRYPWLSVGVAAVTGLAAAVAISERAGHWLQNLSESATDANDGGVATKQPTQHQTDIASANSDEIADLDKIDVAPPAASATTPDVAIPPEITALSSVVRRFAELLVPAVDRFLPGLRAATRQSADEASVDDEVPVADMDAEPTGAEPPIARNGHRVD